MDRLSCRFRRTLLLFKCVLLLRQFLLAGREGGDLLFDL